MKIRMLPTIARSQGEGSRLARVARAERKARPTSRQDPSGTAYALIADTIRSRSRSRAAPSITPVASSAANASSRSRRASVRV